MNLFSIHGWRITKYNPAFRDESGAYLKDDWTSISEVGNLFDGKRLTVEEYHRVESAYVSTALDFLLAADIKSLKVNSLEKNNLPNAERRHIADIPYNPKSLRNSTNVSGEILASICRLVLREVIWCRLESELGFYIHFGWDYYMYVGSLISSKEAIENGKANGLFIEEMMSPYLDRDEQ